MQTNAMHIRTWYTPSLSRLPDMVLRGEREEEIELVEVQYYTCECIHLVYPTLAACSTPGEQGSTPHSRELSRHSHYHQLPHTGQLEGNDLRVPRIGPVHLQREVAHLASSVVW